MRRPKGLLCLSLLQRRERAPATYLLHLCLFSQPPLPSALQQGAVSRLETCSAYLTCSIESWTRPPTCFTRISAHNRHSLLPCSKELDVSRLEACSTCTGSGIKSGTQPSTCSTCNGAGQVVSVTRTPLGAFQQVGLQQAAHIGTVETAHLALTGQHVK